MSFLIALDSTTRQIPTDPTDNFITSFDPPLPLYRKAGHAWHVSLHKLNCWYSFYNISASLYQNNIIGIDIGAGMVYYTIPDGIYNINQLNSTIQEFIANAGGNPSFLAIIPNFPELRIILQIDPTSLYQVDLNPGTSSNFYTLLGFTLGQVTAGNITVTTQGVDVGNITNGIDNLYVNCSLVRGSWFRSKSGRVLFSFVPDTAPGSNIEIIPNTPIYLPIDDGTDHIRDIRMSITDNEGRRVDFNGEDFQYLLHFRLEEI